MDTINIDEIENNVKQNNPINKQEILNIINQQIQTLKNVKEQGQNISEVELNKFIKWKTMLLFLIHISDQKKNSENKENIITAAKNYLNSNEANETEFFEYKNIIIEYQI